MKNSKSPFEILSKEVQSILNLYNLTKWAYENFELTTKNHQLTKGHSDDDICLLNRQGNLIGQYTNKGHLKSILMRSQTRNLRHVLFVRLISALEVFFVDSIQFAFVQRPAILSTNKKKMELTHGQIIATRDIASLRRDLIAKETRALHSAGFKDVVKYYNSQLKISFADLGVNLSELEHSHDKRHLLVHRLGSTDNAYRHKYNEKRMSILIDEVEFFKMIKTINEVALKVDNALEEKVANMVDGADSFLFQCDIEIEILGDALPEILRSNYCFIDKDRYVRNSEFFTLEEKPSNHYVMHVKCESNDFSMIRKVLKRLEKKEVIQIKNKIAFEGIKRRKSNHPTEHLASIANLLPKRNYWHTSIHKDLAKILGTSNNKASKYINTILEDSSLLEELGKAMHEDFVKKHQ